MLLRACARGRPDGITPRLARECLRAAGRDDLVRLATTRGGRVLARAIEHATVPGLSLHFEARKAFIAERCGQMLAQGAGGVLVLGAGYDALAATLAIAGVPATELDQEETQEVKRRVLAALGIAGVELKPFAPEWVARRAPGRIVIAEGLLMYLPRHEAMELLGAAARAGAPGLIATFMESRSAGQPGFVGTTALAHRWLRRRGEPMRWSAPREEFASALPAEGWRVTGMAGHAELRPQRTTGRGRLAQGEVIAVCRRAER